MTELKSTKKSESAKKRWSDPAARKAKSEAMKANWAKRKELKNAIRNNLQETGQKE
jgi:hypothetical protein